MGTFSEQSAANWTAQNPTLAKYHIGSETDTGKAKLGDGVTAWNGLGYWSPGGAGAPGGGALTLATVTADATVGTKQNLLSAVPANTQRVIVNVIARNASTDLSGITGGAGLSCGFDAGAGDFSFALDGLTGATSTSRATAGSLAGSLAGAAGEIFGCTVDPVIAGPATFDVDVLYYDVGV